MRVVVFCQGAPNSHMGKWANSVEQSRASSRISGIIQMGQCDSSRKARGSERSPRSTGFSMANCVPTAQPSERSEHMRDTSALASLSSRRWLPGTSGKPYT